MIVDDIKKRVTAAMKSGDAVTRDVLRLALGEIQTGEARKQAEGGAFGEDDAIAAVRKLVKSNQETLAAVGDADERAAALKKEIEVLNALLPARLGAEQIVALLEPQREAIKAAKSDGQATGVAMKHLKAAGAEVDGKDVAAAVKAIRG